MHDAFGIDLDGLSRLDGTLADHTRQRLLDPADPGPSTASWRRRDSSACAVSSVAMDDTCDIDVGGLSRLGNALADHTRQRLLIALARSPGYPAELALELGESRQSISNHLSCLRGCGFVVARPEGRRMRYELVDARLGEALRDLVELSLALATTRPGEQASG